MSSGGPEQFNEDRERYEAESLQRSRLYDERKSDRFWIHDRIIDEFAAEIGPHALSVYSLLARHADRSGRSFPKQETIAIKLKIGVSTVQRSIRTLSDMKLLLVKENYRSDGGRSSNDYYLLEPPPSVSVTDTPRSERPSIKGTQSIKGSNKDSLRSSSDEEVNKKPKREKSIEEDAEVESTGPDMDDIPQAENEEESVQEQAKSLVNKIHNVLKEEAGIRINGKQYGYNLGKAKSILTKDNPTKEELEELPKSCVEYYDWYSKLDVQEALMRLRQQKRRGARQRGELEGSVANSFQQQTGKPEEVFIDDYVRVEETSTYEERRQTRIEDLARNYGRRGSLIYPEVLEMKNWRIRPADIGAPNSVVDEFRDAPGIANGPESA